MTNRNRKALAILPLVLALIACSLQVQGSESVGALDPANTPTVKRWRGLQHFPIPPTLTADVTAARSLNVREHPGHSERIIGALYTGGTVTLTGSCSNGWAAISWDDGIAWVNSRYLSDNLCRE